MKSNKIVIIMFILGIILSTRNSFAETDNVNKRIAIGVTHSGNPTIRWNKNENISFDFTPSIVYLDNSGFNKEYAYGLDIDIIKRYGNSSLGKGLAISLGYSYEYHDTREYDAHFGIGPDLEYFIPALPNLSIGSQILLNYAYSEINYRGSDVNTYLSKASSISLSGQFLTIRYYFK